MSNEKRNYGVITAYGAEYANMYDIRSFLRSQLELDYQSYFALVYAAYLASLNNIDDEGDLLAYIESKISERRAIFVKSMVHGNLKYAIELAKKFPVDSLTAYMRFYPKNKAKRLGGEPRTPETISRLALKILDIKPNDRIADFGSEVGDFLTLTARLHKENPLYGIEEVAHLKEISVIRAELFSNNTVIELGNLFALPENKKFDKIFTLFPIRPDSHNVQKQTEYIEKLWKKGLTIAKPPLSHWFRYTLILDHLSNEGRAVAIMAASDTWNIFDQEIRKYFIENGFIEAVISFPGRLIDMRGGNMFMIVISRGNKRVKFIDINEFCKGKRTTSLTVSELDAVSKYLKDNNEESITADLKKLQDNDYVIYPPRYLEEPIDLKESVEFESLIKRITRGASLKADKLDEMKSETPTDTQYLMLSNIQNGMITEKLPYLKYLDPKLYRYCIGNRNLLISKNGESFKVAIAEIQEGRKLLGSGNLFIIELDEEKVNPYFIKAFFDSEVGITALKSIAVGSFLPNISVASLKKLRVPCPSMKKQKRIAYLYQAKMDEIKILKLRIQKAQNELKGIFGKEEDD